MTKSKMRMLYAILFLLLLGTEILIGLYVHDTFVRPYLGDVLVVIAIYFFIRIFIPDGLRLLPLYIFLFAVLIECMQRFDILGTLGLSGNQFLKVVLGSSFDGKDIICYACGCVLPGIWELFQKRQSL